MPSLFEFLFNFHRYLIAISIGSHRTTRHQAVMHSNTSLVVSTHTLALQCTLYTITVTLWFRNGLETFILSMPLPLCKGSSGSICKSMLFTGQCQSVDQGWQSVQGVDQRGTGLRCRGGGFVPARERICSMRGNSISPLRERTHSHSGRVTVMPSTVYFSFHLRSHHCCAHH